jgi:hypothetical protein
VRPPSITLGTSAFRRQRRILVDVHMGSPGMLKLCNLSFLGSVQMDNLLESSRAFSERTESLMSFKGHVI